MTSQGPTSQDHENGHPPDQSVSQPSFEPATSPTTEKEVREKKAIFDKEPILELRDLVTSFRTERGEVHAIDHVSFSIPKQSTVGVVGESGCGKSVTSLSIMRLIQSPPGRIRSGEILFEGRDLLRLSEKEMRAIRGAKISMIFQEPMTSLNPVYTVGDQIIEAIRLHQKRSKSEARTRAIRMLQLVGIPSPEKRIDAYPHELSGGMRQRVMIAMALACEPKLLIADEPTTALDVTIQAQVLDLLRSLQKKLSMSVMLITHDLGVVAETADWVVVMYAGQVVEQGAVETVFAAPLHPYTRGLLRSIPPFGEANRPRRLPTIEGMVPDLLSLGSGCRFYERCTDRTSACRDKAPPVIQVPSADKGVPHRQVRCWLHDATFMKFQATLKDAKNIGTPEGVVENKASIETEPS